MHNHSNHEVRPDDDAPLTYYQKLEIAVRELLIEKGLITADEVRRTVEVMDARSPALGAKIVARAWTNSDYKTRLLKDGSAAATELGIEVGVTKLVVVENTSQVHNLVVCTLCSCYPRMILGLPPDWYKSKAYRSRAVREPRAVLAEFGTHIPESVEVRVHDSTATMRYLVLPQRPASTEGMDEEALAALVTRDSMIGVTIVNAPEASLTGKSSI
ncbi:MAG: nitrile hydratase subunit alpha [Symplocastrum torsivum CPER-KK1]|jgi:nitrile hydratase|uniref:nitrile hydratase n=1 Tax=Symplocastrum torsivum CPER-KK1 TaxID=450513 RepID=A0A951UBK3_9CYAN|nr:nitrile hydratase subunit alpha [Symplocastrum torsivum CPER-KK1]